MIDLSKYVKEAEQDEECFICERKIKKGEPHFVIGYELKPSSDPLFEICGTCLHWLSNEVERRYVDF